MCIEVVIERGVLETEGVGGYFVCLAKMLWREIEFFLFLSVFSKGQSAGAEREMRQSSAVRGEEDAACLCRALLLREVFFKNLQLSVRSLCCNCLRED